MIDGENALLEREQGIDVGQPTLADADRRTRLVMITKDMPESFVRSLFDAFVGKVAIDQPDGEALANNPLAPAGLRI